MSICPVCKKRVKRKNRIKKKGIWIHKNCPKKNIRSLYCETVSNHPGYKGRILPMTDVIKSAIIEKEED